MKSEAGLRTIKGIVAPLAERKEGRVVVKDDDREYCVVPRGAGVDLVDELGAQVEVVGAVTEDEDGQFRILVRSYRLIEDFDEWEEA